MPEDLQSKEQLEVAKRFFVSPKRWSPKDLKRLRSVGLPSEPDARAALKSILKAEFALLKGKPEDLSETSRGFRLERLIFKLLLLENLNPHPSYYSMRGKEPLVETDETMIDDDSEEKSDKGRTPGGEQIDGFFELDGRFFLVEAKWTDPIPASALYAFRGLVEGRLAGTLGLFVSAGNFADDAEHALMWGKEICILLANASDLECALENGNSFADMIRIKLREAARVGQVYYSYRTHVDTKNA